MGKPLPLELRQRVVRMSMRGMVTARQRAISAFRLACEQDALCQALGDICHLFEPAECRNFFKVAGYEAN
ncbi:MULTISPECIES: hypothetical protein [unclassified Mesorhizobium]|uniref:hypothetical protein n=1 Tax=unclassified Mesorhizobium TaxID=325217 RepID=UPI0003CE58EB|nr:MULTISPECIES: hypothetical protein [unclassified Mesorhizobium]ESX20557.1 hypothetical protein X767_21085 [Mesorhizobium sp. LSJC264A00]ESX83623.1 hypothetical protein X756_29605 [Mesorhizobium sp. LSHC412B00]ESY14742.1 hypothetical protein X750_30240 [Mesorhizobium sp. LNJC394B00]ESZ77692.1 hypothetical protein X726_10915 [Mesorhizobium sp. L103C105A0]